MNTVSSSHRSLWAAATGSCPPAHAQRFICWKSVDSTTEWSIFDTDPESQILRTKVDGKNEDPGRCTMS